MKRADTGKLQGRIEKLLRNMSPEELAYKLSVSVSTIYRWRTVAVKRPMRALMRKLDEVESVQS